MQVNLLFKDRGFDFKREPPACSEDLTSDLELEKIISVMADGDKIIEQSVKKILLTPLTAGAEILFRQDILKDCISHRDQIRAIYHMLNEALNRRNEEGWWLFTSNPSSRFSGSVRLLQYYQEYLQDLRKFADSDGYVSEGFQNLFRELQKLLDDDFLRDSGDLLSELNFKDGMLTVMGLGKDGCPTGYQLVRKNPKKFWLRWAFAPCFTLAPRDESGFRDLTSRQDLACYESVQVLMEAVRQIENFFKAFRNELAFYVGAMNLLETMQKRNIPVCFPDISENPGCRRYQNLQDLSLALRIEQCVGNDLHADGKDLYIITGANQGGKTTFLRSVGQAQLMMQSGLFAAAEQMSVPVCEGIFTHFKREEDESLKSGKLDEELQRLNSMVPLLKPGSLILFNESMASTNEREGSEICRQITEALRDSRIEQFHVSHLYTFTRGYFDRNLPDTCFLRAERRPDGSRSFRLTEGEPLRTAFGKDLYDKIM